MRIPYDSLCLAAVVRELQPMVGARLQKIVQTDAHTVMIQLYAGREEWLLLSCDAEFARAHLCARRPGGEGAPPPFGQELRRRLKAARLVGVAQRGLDRVLDLVIHGPEGEFTLVCELMGKHANLMLVERGAVVAAAKWVGPTKSRRPILPGKPYSPPPVPPRPSLLDAQEGDDLRAFEGASPFLVRLIGAAGLAPIQAAIRAEAYGAFAAPGAGAYPLDPAPLGYQAFPRESISVALETHFEGLLAERIVERRRASLRAQLDRVLLAREVALGELGQAADAAQMAAAWQRKGELILAYQGQIRPGDLKLEAFDYDGAALQIELKPDLTPLENAQRLFDRARRAKDGAAHVRDQQARLTEDKAALEGALLRLEQAASPSEVDEVQELAEKRRWLHRAVVARTKEERPFEGHAVRELQAPGGWRVLYGDNAEANDYLITRLAKPNDWWLHVRGATSTHVVLQTQGKPERVQRDALMFAAEVAVRHSAQKHSSYVAVDYTLRKYVRRPKGAAPGAATYTNEKTLHVEKRGS